MSPSRRRPPPSGCAAPSGDDYQPARAKPRRRRRRAPRARLPRATARPGAPGAGIARHHRFGVLPMPPSARVLSVPRRRQSGCPLSRLRPPGRVRSDEPMPPAPGDRECTITCQRDNIWWPARFERVMSALHQGAASGRPPWTSRATSPLPRRSSATPHAAHPVRGLSDGPSPAPRIGRTRPPARRQVAPLSPLRQLPAPPRARRV